MANDEWKMFFGFSFLFLLLPSAPGAKHKSRPKAALENLTQIEIVRQQTPSRVVTLPCAVRSDLDQGYLLVTSPEPRNNLG